MSERRNVALEELQVLEKMLSYILDLMRVRSLTLDRRQRACLDSFAMVWMLITGALLILSQDHPLICYTMLYIQYGMIPFVIGLCWECGSMDVQARSELARRLSIKNMLAASLFCLLIKFVHDLPMMGRISRYEFVELVAFVLVVAPVVGAVVTYPPFFLGRVISKRKCRDTSSS